MPTKKLYTSISIWGLLILPLLAACGNGTDYPKVTLNVAVSDIVSPLEQTANRLPLRVAVAAVISPRATFDTYDSMLDYLAHELERPVELVQRTTYTEINDLIQTGQADIAFICGGAFVEGERAGYMELLAVPEIADSTTYQSLIIVPGDSSVASFTDLRGKRFAFTDPLSNSGRLYIEFQLQNMNETEESFFGESIYTYSHDNSIRAVAEGIVDGASIDSLVFDALIREEPQLETQLRVIETSPQYGIPPVVVHPDLGPELKIALRNALLSASQSDAGRAALQSLYVDRFVQPRPEDYESIRNMASLVRGWNTP